MNLIIRKATKIDLAGAQSLFKEVDDYHAGILPSHFVSREKPRRKVDIQNWMRGRDKVLLVAEVDGQLVALINGRQAHSSPNFFVRKLKTLIIETIVVKKEYRKKGIGKSLLQQIEKYAKAKKYQRLALNVFEKNRGAVQFYEEMKFKVVSLKMEKIIG